MTLEGRETDYASTRYSARVGKTLNLLSVSFDPLYVLPRLKTLSCPFIHFSFGPNSHRSCSRPLPTTDEWFSDELVSHWSAALLVVGKPSPAEPRVVKMHLFLRMTARTGPTSAGEAAGRRAAMAVPAREECDAAGRCPLDASARRWSVPPDV